MAENILENPILIECRDSVESAIESLVAEKGRQSTVKLEKQENKSSKNQITRILKNHEGPLTCSSSFVPTDAQSITITVSI